MHHPHRSSAAALLLGACGAWSKSCYIPYRRAVFGRANSAARDHSLVGSCCRHSIFYEKAPGRSPQGKKTGSDGHGIRTNKGHCWVKPLVRALSKLHCRKYCCTVVLLLVTSYIQYRSIITFWILLSNSNSVPVAIQTNDLELVCCLLFLARIVVSYS